MDFFFSSARDNGINCSDDIELRNDVTRVSKLETLINLVSCK